MEFPVYSLYDFLFPIAMLPGWVQFISYWLPLTRGIAVARLLVDGASLSAASWLLYGVLDYLLFPVFEVVAKRRGTLAVF